MASKTEEGKEYTSRLKRLKSFLRSVGYNEDVAMPTLNDVYREQLILDQAPCRLLPTVNLVCSEPTSFLTSVCFARPMKVANQSKSRSQSGRASAPRERKTPRKASKLRRKNASANLAAPTATLRHCTSDLLSHTPDGGPQTPGRTANGFLWTVRSAQSNHCGTSTTQPLESQ